MLYDVYSVRCTMCSVVRRTKYAHFAQYSVLRIMYDVHCTSYNVLLTYIVMLKVILATVQRILYEVYCSLYGVIHDVHCTLYSIVHWT